MDEAVAIAQPFIQQYEAYYREINPGGLPCIGAAEAASFLKRSNLSPVVLGQIWEISDYQKRGILDRRGFFMALKLIAAAQQGQPIQPQSVYLNLGPPVISGGQASPGPVAAHSPASSVGTPAWAISAQDQAKYDSIFESLTPIDGKLPGAKVRPVLLNSGLNPASLAKIWELADQDKDGQLDRVEMSVALHLVYRALQNEPIPGILPGNLIHPSKAHLSRRCSLASQGGDLQYQMNLAGLNARSRAGSMASLDGIGMTTPVVPHQERSMSAQPMTMRAGSAAATPSHGTPTARIPTSVSGQSLDWPVNVQAFAAQFATCDTDNDGMVNGMDVRNVLMSSGLPQPYLAKIWELVDIKKNGTLNLEQFSLALHLINMTRQGEELPMALPDRLIPPSFRQLNITETVEAALPISVSNMSLGTAAQSDNPEIRQLAEEMEKLLEERREADEQVSQLEADMTVKNSAIKNLQIELQTLESTVKQLERQKGEAGRRLADLDEQIIQLEAAGAAQSSKGAETASRLEQLKSDAAEGAASAERDQAAIQEARNELSQLETEARSLTSQISSEQSTMEKTVDQITKMERDFERENKLIDSIKQEIQMVQTLTSDLNSVMEAPDAVEQISSKMLLASVEKPDLFIDTPFAASTSNQNGFHQPPDPFAGHQSGLANVDPFSQADPFVSAPGTNASFGGGFPNDPFTSQSAFASQQSQNASAKATPPPRPAPPKARQTPVNEDPFSNVDPFGGQSTNQSNGGGFADFANFGAFN